MECHKSEALSTVDRGTTVPFPLPLLTRASRGLVSEPHGAVFAAGGKRTPFCPTQGRTLPSGDHAAEGRGGNPFGATPLQGAEGADMRGRFVGQISPHFCARVLQGQVSVFVQLSGRLRMH